VRFAERGSLAVVIPVHNGLEHTTRCLAALRAQSGELAVIVVDDGSTDGTAEFLEREHPDVQVLPGTGDLWWSGAADLGCRLAIRNGAEGLTVLNNDIVRMSDGCIGTLAELARSTGACVSPVVVEELPDGSKRVIQAGGTLRWLRGGIKLRLNGEPYVAQDRITDSDWLPGHALTFASSLFLELGGFDRRRFPQYRGDIDFTLRARTRLGRRCLVRHDCWAVNDVTQTGFNFGERVGLRAFLRGLTTLKSNYNLREAVWFAWVHCPWYARVPNLAIFYLKYCYATAKTWVRPAARLFR
jgi:GT2 family glycosyltransferase